MEYLEVIELSYYEKIIYNLKVYGLYMVVVLGVVIVYVGVSDGVLMDGIGVMIIEDGIMFFDRYEELVYVIFILVLKIKEVYLIVE